MPLWSPPGVVEVRHVAALVFGGDADGEAADLDVVNEERRAEELAPAEDAEGEAVDGDEGLVAGEVVGVELESGAGDLEAFEEGDLELVELDAAVKAGAEGVNDFGFEDGIGVVEKDFAGDEGGDDEHGDDGADPDEDAAEPALAVGGIEELFRTWRIRRRRILSFFHRVRHRNRPFAGLPVADELERLCVRAGIGLGGCMGERRNPGL